MLISGGQRPENSRQPHEASCSEKNDHDKSNQMDELCAALMKTKRAGDEQKAKIMFESYQLLHARKYKMAVAAGARRV